MFGFNASRSPWLDAAQFDALSRHPYAYARSAAAAHPDASPALRARIAREDPQPMTVRAASPTVPLDDATLARSPASATRSCAGPPPTTPAPRPRCSRVSRPIPHQYVRRAVAGNPRAAADVALALTTDPDGGVRAAAVRRGDIPATRLAELESDSDVKVARAARWERKRRALASR